MQTSGLRRLASEEPTKKQIPRNKANENIKKEISKMVRTHVINAPFMNSSISLGAAAVVAAIVSCLFS